ncbi:hypothetical protein IHQ68_17365 [Chelatococcus sambhunathii]|uniref:Holin of 3TMs, for gene-transfer release n=1 Tax=Chelatococcus sambhunathii TaxID=363953 RepID=A0ABU1DJY8_9HYPH|nr:hypothetical protein [Chelatococcus sambhunathii]MDR4308391.1 hypothetical protein [Chelatococcus sambhunathii]
MGAPLTKSVLSAAVENAVKATDGLPMPERLARAKAAVLNDPDVANAVTPIPRLRSETLQGVAGIGAAQLLNAFGVTKTLVIAAGWFGRTWNPDEVSTVLTTVVSLALAGWAWYGRETTSRPLG